MPKKHAKKARKAKARKTKRKVKKTMKKAKKAVKRKVMKRKAPKAAKVSRKAALRKAPVAKKATPAKKLPAGIPVGKVIHYYDRIGVGIVELAGPLRIGDAVSLRRGDEEFSQTVTSMQIEHQPVTEAGRGQVVGLKVKKGVKEGAVLLKV